MSRKGMLRRLRKLERYILTHPWPEPPKPRVRLNVAAELVDDMRQIAVFKQFRSF